MNTDETHSSHAYILNASFIAAVKTGIKKDNEKERERREREKREAGERETEKE